MHHVLQVPELLTSIFDELPEHDYHSLVLVNQQWTNVALRFLWRDISNIDHLIEIIRTLPFQRMDREVRALNLFFVYINFDGSPYLHLPNGASSQPTPA